MVMSSVLTITAVGVGTTIFSMALRALGKESLAVLTELIGLFICAGIALGYAYMLFSKVQMTLGPWLFLTAKETCLMLLK